ncbi:acyltransferase [Candidatus Pantoea persica]|uniref:acyltransferase n=1 Tax=Candidatus Pantoea persica TaxID=2518128 RepID=UPI00215DA0F9|nr:acyltransferase [Candidatus Pantoea persica]MBA2815676.1 putative membrane protein [Candidatus Pantoea persica]
MNRITWVDNLRSMSVLAVILFHITIAVKGDVSHFTGVTDTLNQLFAPVCLGLMLFISGLFMDTALRKGFVPFINNKIKRIFYPFIVWTLGLWWSENSL